MGATDKKAIFAYISSMARQVCAVSEQAEKTGVLGGLDYVLLQSLGYAIVQHVALIDQPQSHAPEVPQPPSATPMVAVAESTSTGVTTSAPPPAVAGDFKATSGKRKLNQHTGEEASSSSSSSSGPKRKRSAKEDTAHGDSRPSSANTATATTAIDEPTKKCLDCGRTKTKTNQWRSGPMGMSTLCNACGMRYTRRLKRQGISMTTSNTNTNGHMIRRGSGVLDSPLCGHESDHGLSPVSSPMSFPLPHSSPMLDDSTAGTGQQQEKRSNLYRLLN